MKKNKLVVNGKEFLIEEDSKLVGLILETKEDFQFILKFD